MANAEFERRGRTHGQSHNVRRREPEFPQHRGGVVRGTSLRVGAHGFRNVGRRPAARGIGDAAVAAREIPDLRFPAQIVAAELVYEQDRIARSGLLMIEPYTVVGRDRGHRVASWFAALGPEPALAPVPRSSQRHSRAELDLNPRAAPDASGQP